MKRVLAVVLSLLAVALGYLVLADRTIPTAPEVQVSLPEKNIDPQPVNNRAGFAIFTNDTIRVFTDPKYHNKSPDVFITATSPNIILVKKAGTTWQQFFDTLPMKLSKDCLSAGTGEKFCNNQTHLLRFYVNGAKVNDLLNLKIKNGDRVLISYGDSDAQILEQLKKVPTP